MARFPFTGMAVLDLISPVSMLVDAIGCIPEVKADIN